MTRHLDKFYRDAREAMLMALRDGYVQAEPLAAMQAMANMAPNREAFGAARYDEMRSLVDAIEHLLSKLEEGQSMNEWRTKVEQTTKCSAGNFRNALSCSSVRAGR